MLTIEYVSKALGDPLKKGLRKIYLRTSQMKNQSASIDKSQKRNSQFQKDSFREKRQIEMKRRFSLLQHRRGQLERELHTIKSLLLSLDRQMQSHSDYEQLSIHS